jgi:hypothetical protein
MIDGKPIGSLIWDDVQNAAYDPSASMNAMWSKYAEDGGVRTSTEHGTQGTAEQFRLRQNYPNPFNPSTNIGYTIASTKEQVAGSAKQVGMERVRLVVYDLLGREVAVLVDGIQTPGEHRIMFDARRLASGMYFYRLSAGGQIAVKRMVLVR